MFDPSVPRVMGDFNPNSTVLATFVVSVYILGFAFGPLIVAPISEYSGRVIVYHSCNVLFLVFNIASALAPNIASLILFRFPDGIAGVTPTTIGSGTIAVIMYANGKPWTGYGPLVYGSVVWADYWADCGRMSG